MTTATDLSLTIEVVGCPTVCLHCWAQGVPYPTMPLGDVDWLLEEAHRFADAEGLAFDAFPMHEVAAHPQAGAVLRRFAAHTGGQPFEPLSTTGVPLATRADWRDVLAAAHEVGTRSVFLAFHGAGESHDRQVSRPGAYRESLLGAERARSVGLRVGANVFVTRANLPELDELAADLQQAGIEETSWEPATFYPTARGRRNERVRPELAELRPVAARIGGRSRFHRDQWADPAAQTEAAHVQRARAGTWRAPRERWGTGGPSLVVRPDLDLYAGIAGVYRERHGNLRAEGVAPALRRALAGEWYAGDAVWFGPGPLPPVAELAAAHGDAGGQGVHFTPQSARYLWLDRAQRARRGR